jgi:hypothetical protein
MKAVLARRLFDLAETANALAVAVNKLDDDSPAAFAACRAGVLADSVENELRELADVISGATPTPKPARHEPRGVR